MSDFPVVRAGLRAVCDASGLVVTSDRGLAAPVPAALAAADAVLLDPTCRSGALTVEQCSQLADIFAGVPVAVVILYGGATAGIMRLLAAGIAGIVDLSEETAELAPSVQAIKAGHLVVSVPGAAVEDTLLLARTARVDDLDIRILGLLARGYYDRDVAPLVGFGESTVKHRVEKLIRAWDLRTRFAAGAWSVGQGLVAPRTERRGESAPRRGQLPGTD